MYKRQINPSLLHDLDPPKKYIFHSLLENDEGKKSPERESQVPQ